MEVFRSPGRSLINYTFDIGLQEGIRTRATIGINFVPLDSQNITVSDYFTLLNPEAVTNADINIMDVTGKPVYTFRNLTINNITPVPIHLSPGLYILNIRTDSNKIFNTKLLVK